MAHSATTHDPLGSSPDWNFTYWVIEENCLYVYYFYAIQKHLDMVYMRKYLDVYLFIPVDKEERVLSLIPAPQLPFLGSCKAGPKLRKKTGSFVGGF